MKSGKKRLSIKNEKKRPDDIDLSLEMMRFLRKDKSFIRHQDMEYHLMVKKTCGN
jgi:hypothetical protein